MTYQCEICGAELTNTRHVDEYDTIEGGKHHVVWSGVKGHCSRCHGQRRAMYR